jgi:YggT family protein
LSHRRRAFTSLPQFGCAGGGNDEGDMIRLLEFIRLLIGLYMWVIIASVVLSWLIAFNVINPYNPFVRSLWQAFSTLTEPLLRPIRRLLPDLGGIDISPMVLWLCCLAVQYVVIDNLIDALRTWR